MTKRQRPQARSQPIEDPKKPEPSSGLRIAGVLGGIITLMIVAHPVVWSARYMMIGWDACSRLDQAPILFECHPGALDPQMLEECTGREMGLAIASTRDWVQKARDCEMNGLFRGWFKPKAEPEPPETLENKPEKEEEQ